MSEGSSLNAVPENLDKRKLNFQQLKSLIEKGRLTLEELKAAEIPLDERNALAFFLAERLVPQVRDLEERVGIDGLTGLPNINFLKYILNNYIQQLNPEGNRESNLKAIIIVYLDIKNFWEFNDTYGHNIGDKALVSVAERLRKVIREGDTAFRLHGDEFVIIMPLSAGDGLVPDDFFKRVKRAVNADLLVDVMETQGEGILALSRGVPIKISMGCEVLKPGDGRTVDDVIKTAEQKMYKDKRKAKGDRRKG